jgi:hypothetical protein
MHHSVFNRKFTDGFALLGGADVFVGSEMIKYESDLFTVKNLFAAGGAKFPDGDGRSDIIPQRDIDPGVDQLSRGDILEVRVSHQNFFGYGISHFMNSFMRRTLS